MTIDNDQLAELESLRAWKAELEKQEPVAPDWYQNPTSEQWFECPDDAQILEDIGAVKVGDIIELDVCWNGKQKFRVAKIADEQSDDVEFELIDGTHLFPAPVVGPDVEKLIADHNSDMAACHEQFMDVSREVMSLKTELEAARKDACLGKDDIDYPRDVFNSLIFGNSPYAFYLFQWVPYQTDARKWRLKMLHDVKTFDGREAFGIWPNGSSCGPFKDSEVEFIRISKKQFGAKWIDPRKSPAAATVEQAKGGVK